MTDRGLNALHRSLAGKIFSELKGASLRQLQDSHHCGALQWSCAEDDASFQCNLPFQPNEMGLLAAVAARSPLTLAGSSGQVIEVAECYCSPSICRLQLIDARPERSRQCQPQCCTPTSYWSLGAGTWVCAHWCAVSQAAFFQEHTLGSRSTQLGERGKFLRWESKWTTLGLILPCDLERTRSGMEPQVFALVFSPAGKRKE